MIKTNKRKEKKKSLDFLDQSDLGVNEDFGMGEMNDLVGAIKKQVVSKPQKASVSLQRLTSVRTPSGQVNLSQRDIRAIAEALRKPSVTGVTTQIDKVMTEAHKEVAEVRHDLERPKANESRLEWLKRNMTLEGLVSVIKMGAFGFVGVLTLVFLFKSVMKIVG